MSTLDGNLTLETLRETMAALDRLSEGVPVEIRAGRAIWDYLNLKCEPSPNPLDPPGVMSIAGVKILRDAHMDIFDWQAFDRHGNVLPRKK